MTSSRRAFRWLVVGAGAAGCHLAHRLAASGQGSVALLEAGERAQDPRTWVPAWYPHAQGRRVDWAFRTQPQSQLSGRSLAWPRGKCLGGCSAINGLIYMWPAVADLERWAQAVGGLWQQSFSQPAPPAATNSSHRCPLTGIPLGPVAKTHTWCRSFVEAATRCGLSCHDSWMQAETGVCGNYWLTTEHGRRVTPATGLLAAQADPSSMVARQLTILSGLNVERILMQQGRAVGVLAHDQRGEPLTLLAEDAVHLSAGTIGSATLLLRSGIGPARHLRAAGIDCLVDAAEVGQNLQDHLVWPIVVRMRSTAGLPYRFDRAARAEYRGWGTGPLSSNLAEVGAMFGQWVPTNAVGNQPPIAPRFQLHVTPTHYLKYPRLRADTDCMSLGLTPLHPDSRGSICLDEHQPQGSPLISPGYLSAAGDVDQFEDAWEIIQEILSQPPLADITAERLIPAPHRSESKGYRRSVSALAQSIYHPVGSCRAGHDAQSVVDDHLRVRGIQGLRVADASVLPDLPSGNTCAAALLVADFAAKLLCG